MRRTRFTLALTMVASAAVVGIPATASAAPASAAAPDMSVQLLTMNDFHGRISATTGSDSQLLVGPGPNGAYEPTGTPAAQVDDEYLTVGGSANIATTVTNARAAFVASGGAAGSSLFVGAGDLVSASPFNSSVFRDEPTIEVLNAIGLDASAVGNHEFDRGTEELRRISAATDAYELEQGDLVQECDGVVVGVEACFGTGAHEFEGAEFPYLAANVVDKTTQEPMLPPYQVFDVGGGKQVALIGVVTETTPTIVAAAGIADVDFLDEATAVNRYVPELQAQGVEAIGVVVHEGGTNAGADRRDASGCDTLSGPIVDINAAVSPAVDLIVSAHSHQAYDCFLTDSAGAPRLVTQAGLYGRLIGDIRLTLDGDTGDVVRVCAPYSAANVPVTRENPDPSVQSIVDYWEARSAEVGDQEVGSALADIASPSRGVESSLGNLVAQAQLEGAQADSGLGDPVVAFMNPGGLRTNIAVGSVTYAELFAVQPFTNTVNSTTLIGADIRAVLEQQFQTDQARGTTLILGTSAGFSYDYDPTRPYGDRVDPASILIDTDGDGVGEPLDLAAEYVVAANSFLIAGGDSFSAFARGTAPATGPVDVDTAVDYFLANSPVAPPAADHGLVVTPSGWPSQPADVTASAPSPVTSVDAVTAAGGSEAAGFLCPAVPTTAPATTAPSTPGVTPVANPGNGIATGQLANTGAATGQMLGLAALLLVSGGVATAAGYRRNRGLAD